MSLPWYWFMVCPLGSSNFHFHLQNWSKPRKKLGSGEKRFDNITFIFAEFICILRHHQVMFEWVWFGLLTMTAPRHSQFNVSHRLISAMLNKICIYFFTRNRKVQCHHSHSMMARSFHRIGVFNWIKIFWYPEKTLFVTKMTFFGTKKSKFLANSALLIMTWGTEKKITTRPYTIVRDRILVYFQAKKWE